MPQVNNETQSQAGSASSLASIAESLARIESRMWDFGGSQFESPDGSDASVVSGVEPKLRQSFVQNDPIHETESGNLNWTVIQFGQPYVCWIFHKHTEII